MTQILWSWDYWDGPLSGLCLYAGRVEWFSCFAMGGWRLTSTDEDDAEWTPRVYRVLHLSWIESQYLMLGHWLFKKLTSRRLTFPIWYRYVRPLFTAKPGPIIGAFSDSESFGR